MTHPFVDGFYIVGEQAYTPEEYAKRQADLSRNRRGERRRRAAMTPEQADRVRMLQREWYARNREKRRAYKREWQRRRREDPAYRERERERERARQRAAGWASRAMRRAALLAPFAHLTDDQLRARLDALKAERDTLNRVIGARKIEAANRREAA